ncbi:uncharacterized protein CTRU02_201175 [Colletotrichum truncatum]|uniref:Uncharacterized protein n=1 Tax=Colletotrichum truncatum TaxID=5467 RepID=A0ACC3ZGK4_COLTU|nr:uncharacterized protein CTRU02_07961 [Colletotrichum truncatum]KAF6790441.1 hypothetical protein CTRU02_07961 [Colletotrichum truncatum]
MNINSYLVAFVAAFSLVDAQCHANNCARAVTGTRLGPATVASRREDCSSYLRTTITNAASTEYITVTSQGSAITRTYAASTVTVTTTVTPFSIPPPSLTLDTEVPIVTPFSEPERRDIEGRQVLLPIPVYASACDGSSAYRSACSCWGVSSTFIVVSTDTTSTVTITSIERDTISVVDSTGITTTTAFVTSTPDVNVPTDGPSTIPSVSELPSETSSDEPSVSTDPPTTLVTSVVSLTSEDPSSTATGVTPTSSPAPGTCNDYTSSFPVTPTGVGVFCRCTYEDPVCAQGFGPNSNSWPLVLTIEICATICDADANCRAFSFSPSRLQCVTLDGGPLLGSYPNREDWTFAVRRPGSCISEQCNDNVSSSSAGAIATATNT